jgi:hypothetical protein
VQDIEVEVAAAIQVIDEAGEGIHSYDASYQTAIDAPSGSTGYFEIARNAEIAVVVPRLELARPVAAQVRAEDLPITAAADYSMYNRHPYEANHSALVILRTRLAERERMEAVLGDAGPRLSTSSLHPAIWEAAARLFDGEHYRQAVANAGQALARLTRLRFFAMSFGHGCSLNHHEHNKPW